VIDPGLELTVFLSERDCGNAEIAIRGTAESHPAQTGRPPL
jgi:hypothetical protein